MEDKRRNAILAIYYAWLTGIEKLTMQGVEIPRKHNKNKGLTYYESPKFLYYEQNKEKSSKWADLARKGQKVMQVIKKNGSYEAVVVDGNVMSYGKEAQNA